MPAAGQVGESVIVRVQREPTIGVSTHGALYVNDRFVCWTLEDPMREVHGVPVAAWKIKGETAIPAGRYKLVLEWSPKFGKLLWELKDVPGFSESKFHAGNRPEDTEGCILVGITRTQGLLGRSAEALDYFHRVMQDATGRTAGPVFADINNPPGLHFAPPTLLA